MTPEIKRFISKLGGLIMAWLFATGMSLMFVNGKGVYPSAAFVMGYALIGAAVLLILGLGRKSFWLTLSALIIASVAAVISGWRPISLLRELSQAQMEAEYAAYIDRIALAAAILLMVIAYVLSFDKHGVFVLLAIALTVSAVMWFLQRDIKVQYTFLPLLAISAQFSVSGAVKQNNLKALLSASVIAAIVSCAVVPSSGVTLEPLEKASENLLKSIIEFFNLDRNDVEERRTFNLITYGWRTQYDAFGGPARPVSDEIMRVKTDETLYLRGSIRYTYNGSAWVDESNSDKAGKIKRYMTTGLEGRIYRSEYESAFDLDKTELLGSLFAHKTADVEILSDNQYWSIYTPNRTDTVSGDNIRVYYNNIGEMFASRQLTADDRYEISYYSFDGDGLMLHEAVAGAAYRSDSAYQAARLLNLDVPEGVDARLFALVNNIISGSPDEYSRAEAICEYLRSHGTYTLNADYVPPYEDFVSNFVLGNMRGYCVHFAASMTLMCRMAGLPARYIEGYLVKPDSDGETLVTGKDAHAWCEVYFKGFGWVTFEATPPEDNSAQGNDSDDSFPGDGLPQNEQGSYSPEPTPTPTPTPTPAPTPSPTPNNWEENDNDDWGDKQNQDENDEQTLGNENENDEPNAEEPQGNQNEENETDAGNDIEQSETASSNSAVLWIALICVVLLLLIALLLMRLRQSRPEVLEQKYKNADDRLLVWYKACIVALEVEGLSMTHGYTPSGYAEKAVQMGIADESFESFSFQVAGRRYSESNDRHFDKNEAERAYKGIIGTMKLKFRFKWYLRRIKNCLGSIEQVP